MKKKRNTKLSEWQDRCKSGMEKCKCGETRGLTVDHIVPVSILQQFSTVDHHELVYNMEENFEIMCRYCNTMKAARVDVRNPKVYPILEKVIAEAKRFYIITKKD